MQQNTLIALVEEVAPLALAAPWDKSGVQVASGRAEVHHLAVSLDPTPDVVRRAVEMGADMLLTHHPLAMTPRFPNRMDPYREVLSLLFRHDIPLYAAHTSLDANPEGPSAWLADELNLGERSLLEPTGSVVIRGREVAGGFGLVGTLPTPLTVAEIVTRLAALLPMKRICSSARLSGGTEQTVIHRLALCTGSGSSLIDASRRADADLFITGDMKYHTALELEQQNSLDRPLAVLDVGHFSLEEEMTRRLALWLDQCLDHVTVTFLPGRDPFASCALSTDTTEVMP